IGDNVRRVFMRQESEIDCGYAVSCMLINYLQHQRLSIDELKFKSQFDYEMLSIENIQDILKNYFINSDVYEVDFNEFQNLTKTPIIVFTEVPKVGYHFVVVYAIKKGKVLVADPSDTDLQ